jgi:hypothetical protein
MYKKASGQKLNKERTHIFFSRKNTRSEVKDHFLSSARVQSTHRYEQYLGLPALVGK